MLAFELASSRCFIFNLLYFLFFLLRPIVEPESVPRDSKVEDKIRLLYYYQLRFTAGDVV